MQLNWDYVKQTTLWHYEGLIKRLNFVTAYPVIWRAYNQDMTQAASFARNLFPDKDLRAGETPAQVLSMIERLRSFGISNWGNLLSKIPTRAECGSFVSKHNLKFEEFIDLLNYLLRWAFPFRTASRELLDHENPQEMTHFGALKQNKLMNSFEILEQGHTLPGRRALAALTGLPLEFVTGLAHRADIARLPYIRRKTILPVSGAGYNTLAKIASADLDQMESDMEAYFECVKGKSWENYKSVIVLKILVTCAKALPMIMEE
jgi:hypothetical protein